MRVLILSQYYKPEPIPKPHELAEGLQGRGHQVTVVTGFPNYPSGSFYKGYKIRPWSIERINGVRVVRLGLYPDHSRSPIRRALNYTSFCMAASALGPILSGPVDVIYVWHPPLTIGLAATIVSLARRAPFVYAVHDLWPESVVAAGMLKNTRIIGLLERLERFIYAQARAIGVVSPGFIKHLEAKGVPREKLHLLTDWGDELVYRPIPPDPTLGEQLGMSGSFNVVFGGQLGIVQGLDTLLDAAEMLRQYHDIQFIIVGDGVDKSRLETKATERGLDNVRFLGRFPSEDMPQIYALADALLVHLKADPIFSISIPGKTYAYMACAKPVLMAVDGVAGDIIRSTGAGLTCPSEDSQALAQAVLQLFHTPRQEREEMGAAAQKVFLERYCRSVGLDRHEQLLVNIANR